MNLAMIAFFFGLIVGSLGGTLLSGLLPSDRESRKNVRNIRRIKDDLDIAAWKDRREKSLANPCAEGFCNQRDFDKARASQRVSGKLTKNPRYGQGDRRVLRLL